MKKINLPFATGHILKIVRFQNQIFLATANGQLITYSLETKEFKQHLFDNRFSHLCFYDILITPDGSLFLCGGASRIASGRMAYPNGFILKTSVDLASEPEFIYHKRTSFVWSLLYDESNKEILISVFHIAGMKSRILCTQNSGLTWSTTKKVKGIVYDLELFDQVIWFYGSKSIFYQKNGLIGNLNTTLDELIIENSGCIYDLFYYGGKALSCNYQGKFLEFVIGSNEYYDLNVTNTYPLYASEMIRPGKLFIVGHGNTIYILNYPVNPKTNSK